MITSINGAIHFGVYPNVSPNQIAIISILPLIAVITSILAVVIILIAFYLAMTRPESIIDRTKTMSSAISDTPKERWQSFSSADFNEFFRKFLLSDEVAVLEVMAKSLISQCINLTDNHPIPENLGWMNKHNIIQESNVSQKRVYARNGIIDRMESLEIIEKKDSVSSWGGMKYLYRLKIDSDFVKAYIKALQEDAALHH
jgi:hypothetical protein